jgi:ArsR family transcriptional regulator
MGGVRVRSGPIFYNAAFGRGPEAPMPSASRVSDDVFDLIGRSEEIEQASHAMKAIAHPLRLKILCLLSGGEITVQDIVEAVGTSQSNISQHLAILRGKKILKTRKDTNKVYYRIADERILRLIALTRQVFCAAP